MFVFKGRWKFERWSFRRRRGACCECHSLVSSVVSYPYHCFVYQEFVKAVEEWRHSRKQNDSSDANPVQTPRTVSVGGSIVSNARQLADALANNLEKEKEEVFKSIQKRREDAERKLQEVF